MTERDRLSLIGHAAMPLMCALDEAEMIGLLDGLVAPGDRVADLGGGRGDVARLCATRFGCAVITVDRSSLACEEARRRTEGLRVEVVCDDALSWLERSRPRGLRLACTLGALHAFGAGRLGWARALDVLAPTARTVLLADLVSTGPLASSTFEVAARAELEVLERRAQRALVLPAERVLAYERAWCDAVSRSPAARGDDPRADWARQRLAWSEQTRPAWSELAFVALAIDTDSSELRASDAPRSPELSRA
jgi:hypothetical protein